MHYYDIKYPYLNYPFRDENGDGWFMYSVPVARLVEMYSRRIGSRPASFFDCGAAVGELVRQADDMGIRASGIDIKKYPLFGRHVGNEKYFVDGRIQIKSILDCAPINADLAYCNGTLTYMNVKTLPVALSRFHDVKMLIAIHNTSEDIAAAAADGWELLHGEPRLVRPKQWWMRTFAKNGFTVDYDDKYGCFCAIPYGNTR